MATQDSNDGAGLEASRPLHGLVVLDFTQILAGPFCTQLLADAGASIIKVEPPGGEFSRRRGPRKTTADGAWLTSYFAGTNRGKRSISIDLKNADGLRLALRLASHADVLIDNFAPGTLERLGINYAELRSQRPGLVTCSISLFGGFETAGELARRGGLAIIAEAESSFASMQPTVDGGAPVRFGTPIGDTCAGLSAYAAIVTALLAKSTTGLGRHLDISMVKALLAHNTAAVAAAQLTEHRELQQRMAGWGYFPSRDGYVAIGVNSDALFARLAQAIGEEWMTADPRYAEFAARDAHADDVDAIVTQWTSVRARSVVVETLTAARVPCGLVANLVDILESEQSRMLGLFETVDDTLGGSIRTPAAPHEYRRGGRLAIPSLDEHGAEILSETLGVGSAEYDALKAAGAFG